nr:hypothetical protein [Tanacetum cinerariifolium]
MDEMTANMCQYGRGRIGYARVLVEVDARKQFKEGIDVQYRDNNGSISRTKKIRIEYSWKPHVCDFCHVFRHTHKTCMKRPRSTKEMEQLKTMKVREDVNKKAFTYVRRKQYQQNNVCRMNQQAKFGRRINEDMSGLESPPELQRSWKEPEERKQETLERKPIRDPPNQSHKRTPSPSSTFIKENIDVLRTMIKEHDQQAKTKATPRRLAYADSNKEDLARSSRLEDQSRTKEKTRRERFGHQETSSDSEYEEGSEDTYEDLNSPYKRSKPTPFTQRITRFKYHERAKLHRNIRVYKRNKDSKDHLSIFSVAAEQEEWSMPVWCKMFHQTLGRATRNWFDDLDPKSVESFEELSQKFLEEFS